MREDRYDDPAFFAKYSQMPRSQYGLEAAGEWETLRTLLPDFAGRRVLDLGCGYGWHCIYALERGAAAVTGVDISEKMLAVAREKTGNGDVRDIRAAMEDVDFPDAAFDVALSSLALHYVADFGGMAEKVYRWLAPGGAFVFSIEHPIFTAYGSQDWYRDEKGEILHFPVDNYFFEGAREAVFLGERVTKYHHTLTTILDGLLTRGFQLRRVVEPQPPGHMLDMEGMRDELRRPMMLLVAAQKA